MGSNLVVCGGTFDHFHKGHEKFLDYVFSLGEKIIIGLTSGEYVKNLKFRDEDMVSVEPYEVREKILEGFLSQKNVQNRASITKINDLFGPTLSSELLIDAIVVSDDSKKGAQIINEKRKELGLSPLKIFIAPIVKSEDGKTISSQRIRKGEIDRIGKLYIKPSWFKTNLVLPKKLRGKFKEPIGLIYRDIDFKKISNLSYVITVGDETSKKFNENSVRQKISVVDFKIARKEKYSDFFQLGFEGNEEIFTANNPSGHINYEFFLVINKIFKSNFKNRIILKVNGEEDLAVLPLILAAPLNIVIYYGQPNEGLAEVVVSEKVKNKAYNLVSNLKPG